MAEYTILLRDPRTLELLGELSVYLHARWRRHQREMGDFEITVNRNNVADDLIARNNIVEIRRDGEFEFAGIIRYREIGDPALGGQRGDVWKLSGPDLKWWLTNRLVDPGAAQYDSQVGVATETALKHYVEDHLTAPADADRDVNTELAAGITFEVQPDASRGIDANFNGRFDNLLGGCLLPLARGADLLHDVVLLGDYSGYRYEVSEPTDATETVTFSVGWDNVEKLIYREDYLGVRNSMYVLGQGAGAARTVEVVEDAGGIAEDFKREGPIDARQADTVAKLQQIGNDRLESLLDDSLSAHAVPAIIGPTLYREHWDVGYDVTVSISDVGIELTRRIVEVIVQLTRGKGEDISISLGSRPKTQTRQIAEGQQRTNPVMHDGGGGGGGGGEANTASNVGTGVGPFKQKAGVDLEFNSIKSENPTIGVALDGATNDIELTAARASAAEAAAGTDADKIITPSLLPVVIRNSKHTYWVDTGAADAYVITPAPVVAGYVGGQVFFFRAANANTGASTLNVNGLGLRPIRKNYDVALAANDIKVNQIVGVIYDSINTRFQMVSHLGNVGVGGGGYDTIEDEGGALAQRTTLDIIGIYAKAIDDAGNTQTQLRAGYAHYDAIVDQAQYDAAFDTGANDPPVYTTLALAIADGHESILVRNPADAVPVVIGAGDAVNYILGDDPGDAAFVVDITCNKNGVVFDAIMLSASVLTLAGIGDTAVGCRFSNTGARIILSGTGASAIACSFDAAGTGALAPVEISGTGNRVQACSFRIQASSGLIRTTAAARKSIIVGNANVANAETGYLIDFIHVDNDGTINGNLIDVPTTATGGINVQLGVNVSGNSVFLPSLTSGTHEGITTFQRCIVTGNMVKIIFVGSTGTVVKAFRVRDRGNLIGNNFIFLLQFQSFSGALPDFAGVSIDAGTAQGTQVFGNLFLCATALIFIPPVVKPKAIDPLDANATELFAAGNLMLAGTNVAAPYPWVPITRVATKTDFDLTPGVPKLTVFRLDEKEDFRDGVAPLGWTPFGTGGTVTYPSLRGGAVHLTTSATANRDAGLRQDVDHVYMDGASVYVQGYFDLANISEVRMRIGLGDNAGWVTNMARPTNGIIIELDTAIDANFRLLVMSGGASIGYGVNGLILAAAATGQHTFYFFMDRLSTEKGIILFDGVHINSSDLTLVMPAALVCPGAFYRTLLGGVDKEMDVHQLTWGCTQGV
jgi:hypothetical protein